MRFRALLLLSAALPAWAAHAGPQGGNVVSGSATIQGQGSANVVVNQFSQSAIVNWNTFNIGAGEHTQFVQPNASSIILNRVIGGQGASQILGSIDANGRVLLVNRDGIIFGAGAVINTAGFLATTSDIKNEDFNAGRYNFSIPGRPDASIINQGNITATSGGFAALVAPGVRNSGTITANLGTVVLGAGNTFTANLDFYGDRLITLGIGDAIAAQVKDVATGQPLKSLITNDGRLKANGGRVELTAAAARSVVDSVINTSGVIEANSVGMRNGQIVLSAATAGTKGSAPTQTIKISGKLSAAGKTAGTKGGKIIASGENIEVANATIDASGREGGGAVMIGGDWGGGNPTRSLTNNQSAALDAKAIPTASTVSVDANSRIDASATDRGDGGKVILWSDVKTTFAGTILALGGLEFGNGGFVETSGKTVNISGTINAGRGGTWLLDPDDLTINAPLAATIVASLNGGTNVTQQTTSSGTGGNGDIFVNAQIVWNSSATLTLSAYRNIIINDTGISGTIKNTGGGNLVLHANAEGAFAIGSGNGIISMPASTNAVRVDWTGSAGKVTAFYNPGSYASPTNFTVGNGRFALASASQLTASMLVNSDLELQGINSNLAGTYALGRDITSFSNVPNFAPLGTFTGAFDGLGHTISHLTIAPTSGILNNIGLFASIGSTGTVRNVTIANASVTANPNAGSQFVGVLAGVNAGTISNVTITSSTVSNGSVNNGVLAGGLVGQNQNTGTIQNAVVTLVGVVVGDSTTGSQENNAGGLVGVNRGSITASSASGGVVGGAHSNIGGLVGRNEAGATIASSSSSAIVAANPSTGDQNTAGGLVGFNFGTINGSNATGSVVGASHGTFGSEIGGLVGLNDATGTIDNSFATGNVTGGTKTSTGGFVGFNQGSVTNSNATGMVASLDNFAGGFVGGNQGTIDNSVASGQVSGGGPGTGGFAGFNGKDSSSGRVGRITNSRASGNVIDFAPNNQGTAGGFVGENQAGAIVGSGASGNVFSVTSAGGFAGSNDSTISNSSATGTATVGNNGQAGGFAAENQGQITGSSATGQAVAGSNSFVGGFVAGNLGTIDSSTASGGAVSFGPNSSIGGFAAVNLGVISNSGSSGAVSGISDSYLGGLVALNFGTVQNSPSASPVFGGANSVAGGLVGFNFGVVDPSNPTGSVTVGPNSIAGGVVGANGALRFPDGRQQIGQINQPASPNPGPVTAGSGSTTGAQVGQQYPTSGVPAPPADPCNGGGFFCGGSLFNPNPSQPQPDVQQKPVVSPLVNIAQALLTDTTQDKKQDQVVDTTGNNNIATGAPGNRNGNRAGNAGRPSVHTVPPPGLGPLPSGMPPLGETRFPSDEVMMQLGLVLSPERLTALMTKYGLEIISTQNFSLLGRTVYRFRITSGLPVRAVIAGIESGGPRISVQPAYNFMLVQNTAPAATSSQGTAAPDTTAPQTQGDSAQYIVAKLGLVEAHKVATGKGVKIAVIDSEIDAQHPDLKGAVTGSYDALPSSDQTPHSHGTGMAGAIGSHQRLLGVAPGARILGVRAFGVSQEGAQGSSMNIAKGLEWAVKEGAQVINMSFAGPRDPILEQSLKALKDRGIVLVGAAGNAGPKSPPLYPGADKNVIGVSATDMDDKTFKGANRGPQVAIAAPGVDILVPAPEGGYQLTTGTSVAAAEISGVVALMLERNPRLTPHEVRDILAGSARKLPQGRNEVGAGLVDPVQALVKSAPKQALAR